MFSYLKVIPVKACSVILVLWEAEQGIKKIKSKCIVFAFSLHFTQWNMNYGITAGQKNWNS